MTIYWGFQAVVWNRLQFLQEFRARCSRCPRHVQRGSWFEQHPVERYLTPGVLVAAKEDFRIGGRLRTSALPWLIIHLCTGYQDKEIVLEFDGHTMTLQPEDSPPLIQRALFHPIDTQRPVESFK